GIPCVHFFRAMRHDRRVQYHIRMVLLRWFREDKQDDPYLIERIKELPFTLATTHGVSITGAIPDPRYLSDYSNVVPRAEIVARARKPLSNDMQLYAILFGRFKGISQDAVKSKKAYERVHRTLDELDDFIASVAVEGNESRKINDMRNSYQSNNNKHVTYGLYNDNLSESTYNDNRIGSNRNPGRNLSRSPSCLQTHDSRPAPALDIDDNYESYYSDSSNVKSPPSSKRTYDRSMDTGSEIESQFKHADATRDSHCIDPAVVRGRGRAKSTRYKPLIERQRKGMIDSNKSLTPKRKQRACG
ncbi:hypothetical protein BGX21_005588, partial [Mortierella sp. AD011]